MGGRPRTRAARRSLVQQQQTWPDWPGGSAARGAACKCRRLQRCAQEAVKTPCSSASKKCDERDHAL
eukprot:12502150-Alexandrium_andersonii.AAC.1